MTIYEGLWTLVASVGDVRCLVLWYGVVRNRDGFGLECRSWALHGSGRRFAGLLAYGAKKPVAVLDTWSVTGTL
jgi:hypothetical protein